MRHQYMFPHGSSIHRQDSQLMIDSSSLIMHRERDPFQQDTVSLQLDTVAHRIFSISGCYETTTAFVKPAD
jgi:hypothetical protein